jgi:hypothetical protein
MNFHHFPQCNSDNSCKSNKQKLSQAPQEGKDPNSYQLSFQISSETDIQKVETKMIQIQRIILDDSLIINIFSPNRKCMKISVIPTDPLYVLNPIFPGNTKVYFYQSDILNMNRSLKITQLLMKAEFLSFQLNK